MHGGAAATSAGSIAAGIAETLPFRAGLNEPPAAAARTVDPAAEPTGHATVRG